MVSSNWSSTFQILNAFCRHFLACRIALGQVREVVGVFYESMYSKCLGFLCRLHAVEGRCTVDICQESNFEGSVWDKW